MGNMLLASPALSDAAIVTGAPTPGALGPTNVQTPDATEVCRFSSTDEMWLEFDFGVPVVINLLWFGYGTAGPDATFTIAAGDTTPPLLTLAEEIPWWRGDLEAAADYPESDSWAYLFDNSVAAQYWRVYWVDPAPVGGAFSLGRMMLVSAPWEPSKGMRFGWRTGDVEEQDVLVSQGKRRYARPGRSRKWAEWSLKLQSSAELRSKSRAIARQRGTNRDVLYLEDHEATGYAQQQGSVYGLLSEGPPINNSDLGLFESSYRVEEL